MREMKDSGIEWIGAIPVSWSTIKNKYIFRLRSGEAISKEALIDEGLYPVYGGGERIGYYNKYNVSSNSFLIGRVGARCGCVTPVNSLCWATDNALIAEIDDMNDYYTYALIAANLNRLNESNAQPLITATKVLNVSIPKPDKKEQLFIAEFLNNRSNECDTLIIDIQSQIEALEEYKHSVITEAVTKGLDPDVEMRDSGVQWIGMMPTHWDCQRGKYILRYVQKPVRDDDGVITCFRDGEVTLRSNRREEGFTMADKEIGYQGIDVGDLVVHGMDGFAGAIGISDSRGKASPVLNVLDTEQNKRYIMYYLRSMAYNDVFVALATGIRVRSCDLRWNKLAELLYPMPPVEEQQAIVEHIDSVLERTNAIIADKKQQIKTIEEYKKSLIFEYVTGKKEVQA